MKSLAWVWTRQGTNMMTVRSPRYELTSLQFCFKHLERGFCFPWTTSPNPLPSLSGHSATWDGWHFTVQEFASNNLAFPFPWTLQTVCNGGESKCLLVLAGLSQFWQHSDPPNLNYTASIDIHFMQHSILHSHTLVIVLAYLDLPTKELPLAGLHTVSWPQSSTTFTNISLPLDSQALVWCPYCHVDIPWLPWQVFAGYMGHS